MVLHISNAGADGMLNGTSLGAQCNNGYVRIYNGTMPTNANTALSGNTMMAEARFAATAFGTPTAGTGTDRRIVSNPIDAVTAVAGDGAMTAAFFRAFASDGTTVVFQGDAGTASQMMILTGNGDPTKIITGSTVDIGSITLDFPTQ